MHRFFVKPDEIDGQIARITGDDVVHISRVLRMREGDELRICDGKNTEYTGLIKRIGKSVVEVRLIERETLLSEPRCKITLYQGLPKGGKFEGILKRCTEVGVCVYAPFFSEHGDVKPSRGERSERYERVVLEAAKQSGRGELPIVFPPMTFDQMAERAARHQRTLVAYEAERQCSVRDLSLSDDILGDVGIVVGPEGGFSQQEIVKLAQIGVQAVTLGRRILRTETAGAVLAALILYEAGDMA